ncbi:hypothetical protein LPN04_30120 [Rugamonas sp. A1-17]|nr:hypothetical protein [Rugamonas sp. A1-17]
MRAWLRPLPLARCWAQQLLQDVRRVNAELRFANDRLEVRVPVHRPRTRPVGHHLAAA